MAPAKRASTRTNRLIGMVHVAALPGTPHSSLPMPAIIARAVKDARVLMQAGFDGVLIENMHDVPYLRKDVGPEIIAGMTAVGLAVRETIGAKRTLGVQVLAGANRAALAVAHAMDANFIRAEGFVFASVADEGLLDEADAGPLLRYRRHIGADGIQIWADIKKKHSSHAITADVTIADTAKAAIFCGADALIVTGSATGEAVNMHELEAVRQAAPRTHIVVGSGVTADTARDLLRFADALIVGSSIKDNGDWRNAVNLSRARALVRRAH